MKAKKERSLYEIEIAIAKKFGYIKNIIVPNVSWGLSGLHECDLLIVTKSGYATEVEIKRSYQDFKNDFNKEHGHMSDKIKYFYYAFSSEELYNKCKHLIPKKDGIIYIYSDLYEYKYFQMKTLFDTTIRVKIEREAIPNKTARKLSQEELLKVAHLGSMRIWSLKQKIIKK